MLRAVRSTWARVQRILLRFSLVWRETEEREKEREKGEREIEGERGEEREMGHLF